MNVNRRRSAAGASPATKVLAKSIVASVLAGVAITWLGLGCAAGSGGGAARAVNGGSSLNSNSIANFNSNIDVDIEREIEEADIVKVVDGYFYLANPYRGLRIIDARVIERPRLVGGLDLAGRGVELFVDRDRAFVVTSADFFTCAGDPVSFDDSDLSNTFVQPDYTGSRITVVDISDPSNPFEISHFDLDGFITATRRVGEVIYAAGNFSGVASNDNRNVNANANSDANANANVNGGANDNSSVADNSNANTNTNANTLPPSTATGLPAFVAGDGTASATVTSPAGVDIEVSVSDGSPGRFVQLTATDARPADLRGIPDGPLVDLTLTADTNLAAGTYLAIGTHTFDQALLDAAGLLPEDLTIYRYRDDLAAWIAAATTWRGESQPTQTVGDFGFTTLPDSNELLLWVVIDELGEFTVAGAYPERTPLTVTTVEGGTVDVTPPPPEGDYFYGTLVTLTASPAAGFAFDGWDGEFISANTADANPITIVLTDETEVTPRFQSTAPPPPPPGSGPRVFVESINIRDANDIRRVDHEDVVGASLDIQVTTEAIYVLGDDPTMADTTRVIYIDISDPAGDIAVRDTFRVPGTVENRFFADESLGFFRIVTEDVRSAGFLRSVALYIYDVTDPDDIVRRGLLPIESSANLRSVRFDGDRAYVATTSGFDPVRVIDLSDPDDPLLAGQVQAVGFAAHLVPLGNRLLAVGFDGQFNLRTALTLYNVTNPYNPSILARISLGENGTRFSTSEATIDPQALKVLERDELVLVPISTFDFDRRRFVDLLQLVDLRPDRLVERGVLEHRGLVRRAGVTDTRLWVLSDESFQVADMDNRDEPLTIDDVDVISEQQLLDAGLLDCVDSARNRGFPFRLVGGSDFVFIDGSPCGVLGMINFAVMGLGLLSFAHRRR